MRETEREREKGERGENNRQTDREKDTEERQIEERQTDRHIEIKAQRRDGTRDYIFIQTSLSILIFLRYVSSEVYISYQNEESIRGCGPYHEYLMSTYQCYFGSS